MSAGTSRHDYLPFGEELSIGRGQVSAYGAGALRQQFTGQEHDFWMLVRNYWRLKSQG
jgi:hypothetical protein